MAGEFEQSKLDKHRRNMMAMAVILLFVTFTGVQFNRINLLGNEVSVGNPDIFTLGLWLVFFYWWQCFVRYSRYYRESLIFDTYQNAFRLLIHDRAINEYTKYVPELPVEVDTVQVKGVNWRVKPSIFWPFFKRKLTIKLDYNKRDDVGIRRYINQDAPYVLKRNIWCELIEWWQAIRTTVTNSPSVVDYLIPRLLARMTLFVCAIYMDYRWLMRA